MFRAVLNKQRSDAGLPEGQGASSAGQQGSLLDLLDDAPQLMAPRPKTSLLDMMAEVDQVPLTSALGKRHKVPVDRQLNFLSAELEMLRVHSRGRNQSAKVSSAGGDLRASSRNVHRNIVKTSAAGPPSIFRSMLRYWWLPVIFGMAGFILGAMAGYIFPTSPVSISGLTESPDFGRLLINSMLANGFVGAAAGGLFGLIPAAMKARQRRWRKSLHQNHATTVSENAEPAVYASWNGEHYSR